MQKEWIDQWNDLGQAAVSSLVRLGQINARAAERIAQQQLDLLSEAVSSGLKQMRLLGQVNDPAQFLEAEKSAVAQLSDKLVASARQGTDILLETQGEMSRWLQEGFSAAPGKANGGKKAA